jgi:hypothetical protein
MVMSSEQLSFSGKGFAEPKEDIDMIARRIAQAAQARPCPANRDDRSSIWSEVVGGIPPAVEEINRIGLEHCRNVLSPADQE